LLQLEEKEAKAKYNAKLKATAGKKGTGLSGKPGTGSAVGRGTVGGGWSTVKTSGTKAGGTAKKATGTGGFAAAFGADSDSD